MLVAIVLVNIAVFSVLVGIVLRQRNHISLLEDELKPRYGFLGKPIYSLMVVALMLGGFGVTFLVKQNVTDNSVSEEKMLEIKVTADVISTQDNAVKVKFKAIPWVDGVEWGGDQTTNVFSFYWSITGPQDVSEFESKISRTNPSGFELTLLPGAYDVRVDAVYLGKTWSKKFSFQF